MKQHKANGHAMPVKSDGVTKLQSDESPVHTGQIIPQKGTVTIPLMYGKVTKGVPLMYGECTGSVLKRYQKGTEEVLRRYYGGTKDIPTACTSPVYQDRRDGEVLVGIQTHGRVSVRNQDVPQNIIGDIPSRRDTVRRGEISFAHSMRATYFLPLPLLLIFICCLFNNAALGQSRDTLGADAGHRIVSVDNKDDIVRVKANPQNDLERYPMKRYEIDPSLITPVQVGDSIPEELMNMPLWVVSKDIPSDTIRLADIPSDHLVVLDFWAGWCAPCVASMDKWEGYMQELSEEIVFFGVHMDYDFKAYPFIQKRDWMSKSIIGLGGYVLNYSFFDQVMVSYLAWIKDRRLIALTPLKEYDLQMVKDIIQGKEASLAIRAAKQRSYQKEKR